MAHPKPFVVCPVAAPLAGDVVVASIGFPGRLVDHERFRLRLATAGTVAAHQRPRDPAAHKGSVGRVLVIAGSPGLSGAAALAVVAAIVSALAAIASALMSLIGLLGGIWAEKFDHLATVTNFVITPLAFLSGTFYSVQQLPDFAFWVTQYNPFFYMIDGFRFALTGHAEGSLIVGAGLLTGLTLILAIVTHVVLARGYRLKT